MSRKEPTPTPDKVLRPNSPPRVSGMNQNRTNEMEPSPVNKDINQAVPGIQLPSIDILNALDYRMDCLKKGIAQATEKQPEEAEKLRRLVSELIGAGEARRALKRNITYLVIEDSQP
ncbi:MAG: hypothetical protein RR308_04630 [Hafnia sp.]